jgi:XrtJ-associated TM-motif-TM protein
MKKLTLLAAPVLLLVVAGSAHGAEGCVDSPESPTAILALVGAAGAFVVSARARWGRRK